jgi:uncharacterized protein (DUF169 family)
MPSYQETAALIQASLELPLAPVAISFVDEVPAGVPVFSGAVPAGCVFWEKAAQGAFATTADDHALCSIGIYTHNLTGAPAQYESELNSVLKVMIGMEYVREQDIAGIPVAQKRAKYAVYAPLAEAKIAPDVVVLFANARKSLPMTEALTEVDGAIPPAMGRPACAAVPQALNSGRAALSLGCCGARAYVGAMSDYVAMWALPGAKIDSYAQRIAVFAKANGVFSQFHTLRKQDVEAGQKPTYAESLARMG